MTKSESYSAATITGSARLNRGIKRQWRTSVLGMVMLATLSAQAQGLTTLYNFGNAPNGYSPVGKLLRAPNKTSHSAFHKAERL